jgi:hypothetical protein
VSDVKTVNDNKPIEPIALMDCGQASKVTKGLPFFLLFELAPPPWDRALLL